MKREKIENNMSLWDKSVIGLNFCLFANWMTSRSKDQRFNRIWNRINTYVVDDDIEQTLSNLRKEIPDDLLELFDEGAKKILKGEIQEEVNSNHFEYENKQRLGRLRRHLEGCLKEEANVEND